MYLATFRRAGKLHSTSYARDFSLRLAAGRISRIGDRQEAHSDHHHVIEVAQKLRLVFRAENHAATVIGRIRIPIWLSSIWWNDPGSPLTVVSTATPTGSGRAKGLAIVTLWLDKTTTASSSVCTPSGAHGIPIEERFKPIFNHPEFRWSAARLSGRMIVSLAILFLSCRQALALRFREFAKPWAAFVMYARCDAATGN